MPTKTKRGLGLLLLGLLVWSAGLSSLGALDTSESDLQLALYVVATLLAASGALTFLIGLGLVIWGLLRD